MGVRPSQQGGLFFVPEQITGHRRLLHRAPAERGIFIVVIVMSEMIDFFEKEANECRRLAANATRKDDQEFWLRLSDRGEGLLRGQQNSGTDVEAVRSLRPTRPIFTKKRQRAA
jgi:hypothetical protein